MARPRTPTRLKLIKGTLLGHPENRRREIEPTPAKPDPPHDLSPAALAEWHRIADELFELQMLSNLERALLVFYVEAWSEVLEAKKTLRKVVESDPAGSGFLVRTKGGGTMVLPLRDYIRRRESDCVRHMMELGMTPAARARMGKEDNPATRRGDAGEKYFGRSNSNRRA
jgi:P27 family predicted phage terminase small subunit